jgi:hypothetical protein
MLKRTHYEIFWEILTFCRTPHSFKASLTAVILTVKSGKHTLIFSKSGGCWPKLKGTVQHCLRRLRKRHNTLRFLTKLTANSSMKPLNSNFNRLMALFVTVRQPFTYLTKVAT